MSELEPTLTNSNLTVTERLRAMLDERGVEWTDGGMFHRTHWVIDGVHHTAFEQDGKLYLQSSIGPLTPEQAIAATLGAGTCHEIEDEDTGFIVCSECGAVHDESYTAYYCWCCGRRIVQ